MSPALHPGLATLPRIVPVLAGGGTRLPAHVGVLAALDEMGVPYDHMVGVSGGSIVAALHAVGKRNEDLRELFTTIDFRRFKGFSLYHLITRGGLSTGHVFQTWLDELLEGARFTDLELDLHVVATDVVSGTPVIFDRARTPDMHVAEAVRASMGIPLLFTFHRWQDKVLVDGSILAEDILRQDWVGDATPSICFRLRASELGIGRRLNRWFPVPDYLAMLLRTFMNTLSREYVAELYWNTTVLIDSGAVPPTEFALTVAQKMQLFEQGYHTTLEILPHKLLHLAGNRAGP